MKKRKITIVGSGVSGLTVAVRLLEAGYNVSIIAREFPPNTTSNVAPAWWLPRPTSSAPELNWAKESYQCFTALMADRRAGVSAVTFRGVSSRPIPTATWWEIPEQFVRAPRSALPAPWVDGITFRGVLIETPIYLPFLLARVRELGGSLVEREVQDFTELLGDQTIVVNCTGLGAREVCEDQEVFPLRGQIVRVEKIAALSGEMFECFDSDRLSYVIPRSADCILGGTAERDDWQRTPRAETADLILRQARELVPALKEARVIEHLVGLRPGRERVRLALERGKSSAAIIHNYGHMMCGYTYSWGCAKDVLALVDKECEIGRDAR